MIKKQGKVRHVKDFNVQQGGPMIIPLSGQNHARDLAAVYNSANTLFPEEQRCDADETVFYRQLREDRNFLSLDGDTICGFMSWRRYTVPLCIQRDGIPVLSLTDQPFQTSPAFLDPFRIQLSHGGFRLEPLFHTGPMIAIIQIQHI